MTEDQFKDLMAEVEAEALHSPVLAHALKAKDSGYVSLLEAMAGAALVLARQNRAIMAELIKAVQAAPRPTGSAQEGEPGHPTHADPDPRPPATSAG